jgi:choline monooxygenase
VGGPGQNAHPGIDRKTLGLIEVPSHVWRDVVFVNLSGDAAPFEEIHAELIARWAEVDLPLHHGGPDSSFTLEVATNWKLAVENYCESYHLPWVHPGLNSYSRLEDHYHVEAPGRFSGQGTLCLPASCAARMAASSRISRASPRNGTKARSISRSIPTCCFGAHRDHAYAIVLEPQWPDRTREHVHLYYPTADTDPALRARNAAQWKEVFIEDIGVVEGMQRGRAAKGFDGGRFSPAMDGPTHCFHAWVAGRVAALEEAQG